MHSNRPKLTFILSLFFCFTAAALAADVPAEEYELLAPLAAKAFIAEDRRKMIYLHPEIYENASEEVWNRYYFSTDPDGYCRGSHMDLSIVRPFAQTAELGAWKRSRLEAVKEYIRSLL